MSTTIKYVTKSGGTVVLNSVSNVVTGSSSSLSSLFNANALAQKPTPSASPPIAKPTTPPPPAAKTG